MKRHVVKKAFTLAEVLITLAIIGIVAALTIPTLISNYEKKVTLTRLQKTYSILTNAFELGKVEHGDYSTWSWNHIPQTNGNRVKYFWETYILSNLRTTEECFPISDECISEIKYLSGTKVDDLDGAFILNDGTIVASWAGGDRYYPHIWIYVDINGKSEPNTVGKDVFVMYFSPNNPGNQIGSTDDEGNFTSEKTIKFGYGLNLYGDCDNLTLDELMDPDLVLHTETGSNSKIGCSTQSRGLTCGAAIKKNGWKFPENYPE